MADSASRPASFDFRAWAITWLWYSALILLGAGGAWLGWWLWGWIGLGIAVVVEIVVGFILFGIVFLIGFFYAMSQDSR